MVDVRAKLPPAAPPPRATMPAPKASPDVGLRRWRQTSNMMVNTHAPKYTNLRANDLAGHLAGHLAGRLAGHLAGRLIGQLSGPA